MQLLKQSFTNKRIILQIVKELSITPLLADERVASCLRRTIQSPDSKGVINFLY